MTTDVHIGGLPLSNAGALQTAPEAGAYPASVAWNSGFAVDAALGQLYVQIAGSPSGTPTTSRYSGGIGLTEKGAVYITDDPTSGTFYSNGAFRVRSDGALLVSIGGTIATYNQGIGFTAGQAVVVGGSPPAFGVDFNDLGSGVVNLVPAMGAVSATFTRATTAWTISSTGTWLAVASGSPRSYYSPTGTYLGYLAEGARTNLVVQSQDFSATWAAVGTPTRSAATTTLGVLILDTIGDDSAAALEGYTETVGFTGDAVKAISIFVKKGTATSSVVRLRDTTAPADRLLAAITWSGTVPVVTMTTGTDLTGTPQQFGSSGVYRLSFATTSVTAANTNSLQLYPATDAALDVAGTGTIIWGGVQAENALFPSSYIVTTTAAVARNADVLTYPTSPWLNAGAGTVFYEGQATSPVAFTTNQRLAQLDDGTDNDIILVFREAPTGHMRFNVNDGGASQCNIDGQTAEINTTFKVAGAYAANDFSAAVNGVLGTPDTSGTLPTVTTLRINNNVAANNPYFGPIRRVAYYGSRLANATLQALTA